jgi:hypothetical protein
MSLAIDPVRRSDRSRGTVRLCFGLAFLWGICSGFRLFCLRLWLSVVGRQGKFADSAGVGE